MSADNATLLEAVHARVESPLARALYREFEPVESLFRTGASAQLLDALTEPGRIYHDIHHILTLLKLAQPLWEMAKDPLALRIAIFYHDSIYHIPLSADTPPPRDNEERSVRFMAMQAKDSAHPSILRAAELIRGTATHDATRGEDGPLMQDLDLAVLAVRRSRYAVFERAMRSEYEIYPQPLYCAARLATLKSYLDSNRIYATPYLSAKWEAKARDNLVWAIGHLTQGLIPGEMALV